MASCEINFQTNFSLQHFAMISYAGSFWNTIFQTNRMMGELVPVHNFRIQKINKFIYTFMKEFKEKLKVLNVPGIIFEQLVEVALSTGLRAVNWCYVVYRLQIPEKYTKTLYWTGNGTIDQAKIVETDWLQAFSESKKLKKNLRFDFYYMVCICTLQSYVDLHWKKILNFCLNYIKEFKVCGKHYQKCDFIICSVLALTNPVHLQLSQKQRNDLLKNYPALFQQSKEVYMFTWSVRMGYDVAARYYWNLLNETEKMEEVLHAAVICVKDFCKVGVCNYFVGFQADILTFLLSQMTQGEVQALLVNLNTFNLEKILAMFVNTPCWKEFFMKLFVVIKTYSQKGKDFYHNVVCDIVQQLSNVSKLGLDTKRNSYRSMFFLVWKEVEKFRLEGGSFIEKHDRFLKEDCLYNLFDNLDILSLIINFECREESRKKFLVNGKKHYLNLIEKNRYDALDKFMKIVLRSEDERKWFKDYLKFFNHFLFKDQLDILDKLIGSPAREI